MPAIRLIQGETDAPVRTQVTLATYWAPEGWPAPRRGPERGRDSSSGSCNRGLVALATTSPAMSITLRPRLRAASRSCSNACRGLIRCRSASTPIACSTLIRVIRACSSWPTVALSFPVSLVVAACAPAILGAANDRGVRHDSHDLGDRLQLVCVMLHRKCSAGRGFLDF